MKIQKKQAIGENLLYVMVWTAIILVPVLNSQMMSEMHVNLENVLTAWRYIAPYLIIFLIHNAIIAPRYMLRRKYGKYLASNLALIISVFWLVQIYEDHLTDHLLKQNDPEALDAYRKASFSNLEMYWNVVLGFFMTGANTGIKLIYQSMRDEQQMEALKRQNLQAEMDYLKYQINPHFFMNTLNNIHALIDIDTESAKNAVIELSKMMRYVQQPPRRPEQQTPRGNRTGERPQTPRTDLRREELLAGNPRGGEDLYRKTRNPDAQCLNVSPSTTSRWLCVS